MLHKLGYAGTMWDLLIPGAKSKIRDGMPQDSSATDRIWCVVPVYNNGATVKDVVAGCCFCPEECRGCR